MSALTGIFKGNILAVIKSTVVLHPLGRSNYPRPWKHHDYLPTTKTPCCCVEGQRRHDTNELVTAI